MTTSSTGGVAGPLPDNPSPQRARSHSLAQLDRAPFSRADRRFVGARASTIWRLRVAAADRGVHLRDLADELLTAALDRAGAPPAPEVR